MDENQDRDAINYGAEDVIDSGFGQRSAPQTEPEAAFRHREKNDYEVEEVRPNQLAPSPLRETTDEPTAEPFTMGRSDAVNHQSR